MIWIFSNISDNLTLSKNTQLNQKMKARFEQFSSTLLRTQPSSSLTVKAGHTDSRQTGVALTPAENSPHKQRTEGRPHNACKDKLIQRPSLCVSFSIHLSHRQYFDHFVQLNQISALQTKKLLCPSTKHNFHQLKIEENLMFPTHVILKLEEQQLG